MHSVAGLAYQRLTGGQSRAPQPRQGSMVHPLMTREQHVIAAVEIKNPLYPVGCQHRAAGILHYCGSKTKGLANPSKWQFYN
jgi:hypothetical protein